MSIRIRTKIIISFSFILVLLTFLGYITYYNRNLLFESILKLEGVTEEMRLVSDIQLKIERVVMPPNDYLITGDPEEKVAFVKAAREVEKGFERLIAYDHDAHLRIDRTALKHFKTLKRKAERIFAIREPVADKSGARLMKELDHLASDINSSYLDKTHEVVKRELTAEISYTEAAKRRVNRLIAVGAVTSLVTFALLTLYLIRSIVRPITMFQKSVGVIGGGDLDHRIDLRDGVEMNTLADGFNTMALRLKESYAALEDKVTERTRELKEANEKLKELSLTDGLTGTFNRRYFDTCMDEEIKRALRYERDLSLIMVDIDYFKLYNDANGHIEGDRVLKEVATCLTENVRRQDSVARYGGEEFAVILPETGKKAAGRLAERIRLIVERTRFSHEETQPGKTLTISLGVATSPGDAFEVDGLIKKADAALYSAKGKGRNAVELA